MKTRALVFSLALLGMTGVPAGADVELASPYRIAGARVLTPRLLDAPQVCLPDPPHPSLNPALRLLDAGELAGLRRSLAELAAPPALPARRAEGEPEESDTAAATGPPQLEIEILQARAADTRARRQQARGRLDLALASGRGNELLRACARLERSRLELGMRLAPEASASAKRALQEEALTPLRRQAGEFYRAEAALQGGRQDLARESYARLAESENERLAAAALIRLASLPVAVGQGTAEPAERFDRLASLLERGTRTGLHLDAFAHQAAELALAAGRLEDAHRWLARAETDEDAMAGALASIRKADVLIRLERPDDARRTLERVAGSGEDANVRALALARLYDHDLARPSDAEDPLDPLRRAIESGDRGVSLYARGVLAHWLVSARRESDALDELVRLAYLGADSALLPRFRTDLDTLLGGVSDPDSTCSHVLRMIGGRRHLLLEHAGVAEPFLRLGDCFLELGMPVAALDAFRGVTRRFGPDVAAALTLRIARSQLGVGERAAVDAVLRARERRGKAGPAGEEAGWNLLRAEIDLADGRMAAAVERLDSLVAAASLGPADQARALLLLSDAAVRGAASEQTRNVLRSAVSARPSGPGIDPLSSGPGIDPLTRGEVALVAADLFREAGELAHAQRLYARSLELLPPGSRRARAAYRLGLETSALDPARQAWETGAADADPAWSELAASELRLIGLRHTIGRPGRPPR